MPSPKAAFLLFLLVLMESLSGFAVVVGSSLLDATTAGYSLFPLLLAAQIAGLVMALLIAVRTPREPWNRVALVAGGALGALVPAIISSRNPVSFLVSAVLLGVMYWRGIVTAEESPIYDHVKGRFGLGYSLLFLGLLWIVARGIVNQADIVHMLAVLGIAYTIVAMVALTTARIEPTREPGAGGAIVLAVAVQLGLLLLLGLAALQIFSMDIAGALLRLARPVTDVVGLAWYNFLLLLAGPVQHAFDLLRPHAHRGQGITYTPPSSGQNARTKRFKTTPHDNPIAGFVAFLMILLIIAAIGVVIWRALPRIPHAKPQSGYRERREGMLTLGVIWAAVRLWFSTLFRRSTELAEQAVYRTRRRIFPPYPADPVRKMYTQLLRRAAAAGISRPAAATPAEYGRHLASRWPDVSFNLSSLTNAYMQRRYGEIAVSDAVVSDATYHWQQVRHTIRIQRSHGKGSDTDEGEAHLSSRPPEQAPRPWQRAFWSRTAQLPGGRRFRLWQGAVIALTCLFAPILLFLGFLLMAALLGAQP